MSKSIVIQEGEVDKTITTGKLTTNEVGGGTVTWVPEDEVELTELNVTENGTYIAANEGYYGYSQVTVNGIGEVTGIDADGDEVFITADDETGEIDITKLPSTITFDTLPDKYQYQGGETIDLTGAVVKAYMSSEESPGVYNPWSGEGYPDGIIPNSELNLPVSEAEERYGENIWTNGHGIIATLVTYRQVHWENEQGDGQIAYVSNVLGTVNGHPAMLGDLYGMTAFFATVYNGYLYTWDGTQSRALNGYYYNEEDGTYNMFLGTSARCGTTEMNRMAIEPSYRWVTGIPESTVQPSGSPIMHETGTFTQTVVVEWERPGDYKTLATSFNIDVEMIPEPPEEEI